MFLLSACGEFIYSPYILKTKNLKSNIKNIELIKNREVLFSDTYQIPIIGDSHNYYSNLIKQINYINRNKSTIPFVIHVGDVTNFGLLLEWEMFYEIIKKLEVPFILVIGNHDLLLNGKEIYKQMFGDDLNFSLTFRQTKYIFYNNNNWESNGIVPDYKFLEKELELSDSRNFILSGHIQPDDRERFTKYEIDRLINLINSYNVKFHLNGHNHNYSAGHFGKSIRLTAGSSSKGRLLILQVNNNENTYEFIVL